MFETTRELTQLIQFFIISESANFSHMRSIDVFSKRCVVQRTRWCRAKAFKAIQEKFPETQFFAFPPTKNVPLLKENFEVNSDNSVANHYNVSFLDSFEAALEQEVDLCVIATPSIMHEQDIVSALSCGMNVFCEKPAITSTTMCERITRLTEEKNFIYLSASKECTILWSKNLKLRSTRMKLVRLFM